MAKIKDNSPRHNGASSGSHEEGGKSPIAIRPDSAKSSVVAKEEEILKFWEKNNIFQKSLEKESPNGEFVFYEGPPTANGRPGIHHFYQRAFKDLIPRYKTMQGYHVRRKAGWDTHGLPVEIEVEKQLGIKSKKDIETFGIAEFNKKCKENVWKYVDKWRDFSERMAFWLDYDNPYVTYEPKYIESVWNIIKKVDERGLLYKDYKVLPWCPRCGTALSSHELAQGYDTVKDLSLTVKFRVSNSSLQTNPKFKSLNDETYLLAWTTTPWTLPGNVALAVNEKIKYTAFRVKDFPELLIAAKDRVKDVVGGSEIEIVHNDISGKDLAGLEYEPLFPFLADKRALGIENAFKVYPADFVSTEEGTGIVHTAVMYGQDDFVLGTEVGLPKEHLVGEDGRFLSGTGELEGKFVKDEETDVLIIKYLHANGLLFKKEKHEHTYPFCWRCKTPLIYYARDSWYIQMSKIKKDLIKENQKINWEPKHIKNGRFGEWLAEVKDWAVSRERYWGTPLPVWISSDGRKLIIGSVEELKKFTKKSGNKYFVLRHGEAEKNLKNISSTVDKPPSPLTPAGKERIKEATKKLKQEKIDIIFTSPLKRTNQTAVIVAETLGLSAEQIVVDERLTEVRTGEFDERPISEYHRFFSSEIERFERAPKGAETLIDVKKRVGAFIYEIDNKYSGKNILVVSHEDTIWMLEAATQCLDIKQSMEYPEESIRMGESRSLEFVPLPHNENFELDLHKPYIDEVVLEKEGVEYRRVKEVMDVWLDSGSMPFAQDHYPFNFAQDKLFVRNKLLYPADYICEGLDQTRGWFYTLHAVGSLMEKGLAYRNVICLGILLDDKGEKMSKSKGNVIDPWRAMDMYSADSLRFWMYSVNQPGESKNFDEKMIEDVVKKVFNLLLNVVNFYEMYADTDKKPGDNSPNILDRWIIALLGRLSMEVSSNLDDYKVMEAARAIREFIADLSQWYLRRSRERFKEESEESASGTLSYVLLELSKIMAPFTPFIAEDIYKRMKGEKESVHLENWPALTSLSSAEERLIEDMSKARRIVSLALEARAKAGIKTRQPLRELGIKNGSTSSPHVNGLENKEELLKLIKDEVNVKEVSIDPSIEDEVFLNTALDEELVKEGHVRDLVRAIQDERKKNNLKPSDRASAHIKTNSEGERIISEFKESIVRSSNLKDLTLEAVAKEGIFFEVTLS